MPVIDSLAQSALRSVNHKQEERETIWANLQALKQKITKSTLQDKFHVDPNRAEKFTLTVEQLCVDYSKNHIDEQVIAELIKLANSYDLKGAISQLMSGVAINVTENRSALHTALRRPCHESLVVDSRNIMQEVEAVLNTMESMIHQIESGMWKGATQQIITDVVNIGIGGSDLGPQFLYDALTPYHQSRVNIHFVSNIDPISLEQVLACLNPETTLFVVSSKSFTTLETLTNANQAKQWLATKLHAKQLDKHFVGVTANPARAVAWGINNNHILPFWDWVGGRFSIWSSIAFPVALKIGMTEFRDFLSGGYAMDVHFATAPLQKNMPVILALLGIWYRNVLQMPTHAICPYGELLKNITAYLQQLDMESNGKLTKPNGDVVSHHTGPIIWGGQGTNAQHAFFQLLHQGCHAIPVDFIVPLKTSANHQLAHQQLVINCIAQAKALMAGTQASTASSPVAAENISFSDGNRPSTMIMLEKLSPYALGELIALYEHKIFIQGIIWQINSFDQPGVELGKKLATNLERLLADKKLEENIDSSTLALLNRLKQASSV